ncbi:MAG TPA: hypothetical protein VJ044_03035 [Candidatus Hodarchaeales archaeon]|nr:hypothetical protein [Candidatus Hodarchaeales archaeon]
MIEYKWRCRDCKWEYLHPLPMDLAIFDLDAISFVSYMNKHITESGHSGADVVRIVDGVEGPTLLGMKGFRKI